MINGAEAVRAKRGWHRGLSNLRMSARQRAKGGPALLCGSPPCAGYFRSLVTQSFIPGWQPTPQSVNIRVLASVEAAALVAASAAVLTGWGRSAGAWSLALILVIWIVILQSPGLAAAPGSVVVWLGVAEVGALLCAAIIIACASQACELGEAAQAMIVEACFVGFGACAVIFALSHFVYADFTARMVPALAPSQNCPSLRYRRRSRRGRHCDCHRRSSAYRGGIARDHDGVLCGARSRPRRAGFARLPIGAHVPSERLCAVRRGLDCEIRVCS